MYPAASLLHAGATVAYGSDWPVASANPLEGMLAAEIVHDELGAEISLQRAHQRGNVSAPAE